MRKIRAIRPRGPYHLGGLCVAGLLAYEVAAQLTAAGEEVGAVVMLDALNLREFMAGTGKKLLASRARFHWKKLTAGSLADAWRYLVERFNDRVANIRTITSASVSYSVTYANGYPPGLAQLGGIVVPATCNASILVDTTLSSAPNQKSGYQFTYTGQGGTVTNSPAGCSTPGYNGYLLTAVPLVQGVSGNVSYCSTEQGVIFMDPNGSTPATQAACLAMRTLQ